MEDFQTEIANIIQQIEDKIEHDLNHNLITESETKLSNEKLSDRFKRQLGDGSSSDSSSSSLTSSDDDEHKNAFRTLKTKIKKTMQSKTIASASESSDEEDAQNNANNKTRTNQIKYVKTKNELTLDEMAPAERVDLTLDSSVKMERIGKVISKVDKLVVVQSLRTSELEDTKPLDEETILFDSNRKSLGKIFEIFGPVTGPFYSIRLNDLSKEIEERKLDIELGSFIFYVPDSGEYTKFIFNIDELRKTKGSDASWSHDNEPPAEFLDYSDDEQEKEAKRSLKQKNKSTNKLVEDYSGSEESTECEIIENEALTEAKRSFGFKKSHSNQKINNTANNKRPHNSQIPKSQTFSHKNFNSNNNNNNNNNNSNNQVNPNQAFWPNTQYQNHQNQFFNGQAMFMPPNTAAPMANFMPPFGTMPTSFIPFNPYMMQPSGNVSNPSFAGGAAGFPSFNPMMMANNFQSFPAPQQNNQQFKNSQNFNNNRNRNYQQQQQQQSPQAHQQHTIVDKRFVQNPNFIKKSF